MTSIRMLRDQIARTSDTEPARTLKAGEVYDIRDATAEALVEMGAAERVSVVTDAEARLDTVVTGADTVEAVEKPAAKRKKGE
jgi:hypothetical protein